MDRQQHDRKEGQHLTAVWRNGGFSASYDSIVVGSSAVLRLNFCAKNPPLRQAAKRYAAFLDRPSFFTIFKLKIIYLYLKHRVDDTSKTK